MDRQLTIRDCTNEAGNFDADKFNEYRKQRDSFFDEIQEDDEIQVKRGKFTPRFNEGYDPNSSLESQWYKRYVKYPHHKQNSKHFGLFRRRFRMPHESYRKLVNEARDNNWFPQYENYNAIGQKGISLDILILGALRYLGRGWTFDDIFDATNVSEAVHRKFFKDFTIACRTYLYPKWVKRPETQEEIEDGMSEFKEAGFDGCIGSADVTHVVLERCHSRLKNQNLGGKSSHTTRAFQIVVNHRRQIIASTVGYPGRWNDMTIVRFDGFVTDVQRGLYLQDNQFTLKNDKGEDENHIGAWILVDGGYLNWSTLICPFKDSLSVKEERWSSWAESMRKDVECTFGILKGKMLHLYLFSVIRNFRN